MTIGTFLLVFTFILVDYLRKFFTWCPLMVLLAMMDGAFGAEDVDRILMMTVLAGCCVIDINVMAK